MASQHEAGSSVQHFGQGVNELPHGAEVLAVSVPEIHQSKISKGEGILLRPHGFVLPNSERVGAGHLGAVGRELDEE